MSEINKGYLDGMIKWVRDVKGITEIDIIELAGMQPEYEDYRLTARKDG